MASLVRLVPSSIKFTVGAPLCLLVVVLIGIIGFSATSLMTVSSKAERVATVDMASVATLADVSSALQSAYLEERSILTIKVGSEQYVENSSAHGDLLLAAENSLEKLKNAATDSAELERIAGIQQRLNEWKETTLEVFGLRDQDSRQTRLLAVNLSGGDSRTQFDALYTLLTETRQAWLADTKTEVDAVIATSNTRMQWLYIVGSASALLGLLVAIVIPLWLTRRLKEIKSRILDIAHGDGDLTRRIDVKRRDEIASIASAFNEFSENLHGTIVQTSQRAIEVARSAREISEHNNKLAGQSELQAEAVKAASDQLADVARSIAETSSHASQVSQSARATSNSATEGDSVIEETIAAMADVSESSNQIGMIISMVDSIAFQTNILALNAAVEAARAGEQGRGFAVVASEVRDLAQRSADAANDIKRLSQTTTERVQLGSSLVSSSGERLKEIVQSIHSVSGTVDEISDATQSQNDGLQSVNTTISQMRDTMQSTTAFVREVADASAQLEEGSAELLNVVSRFKVTSETASAQAA